MSPRDDIRLFVVIPVYGNWVETLATLRALAAQDCNRFRVLIADDGTPSEPPSEIHDFEFAKYVKRPNAGFAANCNRAARMAIEKGATHLLFLNNDTDFSREFISGWLRTAARMPNAIVSPIVYWFHRPQSVWFSGGKMTILTPFVRLAREFSGTTQVDIVCGCALLVPLGEWERLHGFDETFALYFEDFDLALRAKAAGIPIFVAADRELHVWHKVSGSFRGGAAWMQEYPLLASRLLFIRRHFQGPKRLLCYVMTVLHLIAMFVYKVPGIPSPRLLWRAAARGMADGRECAGAE
jgi:GT2 family glycosyltransferase